MRMIKALVFAFVIAAVLPAASTCRAQSSQQAIISASLTTQVEVEKFATVPITNATIINAIVASGSFPGLKAKDCAIVLVNDTTEPLEVINVANSNALLVRLGVPANNAITTGVRSISKTKDSFVFTEGPYDFTVPGVANDQTTTLFCKTHNNPQHPGGAASFFFTFVGGNGLYNVGSTVFQGSVKSGPKTY